VTSSIIFLSVDDVLAVHLRVIQEFGGDSGLRDRGMLESAVKMPQAVFGGQDLHPDLASKAAAYHFHSCSNHPFVDGDKRVAVATAELFLILNGFELSATDDEIEEMTLGVARGEASKDQVVEFFEKHQVSSTLE
jgi:death-on-curing protein